MKVLLVSFLTLISLTVSAQNVSETDALMENGKISKEQALEIASRFVNNGTGKSRLMNGRQLNPRLIGTTLTPTSHEPAVYVVGFEGNGYVLVNAEGGMGKTVLAYSDAPLPENEEDYPEAFRYWLGEYARQIEYMHEAETQAASHTRKGYARDVQGEVVVAPLLGTTEWDQGEPYNSFCPEVEGAVAPTGCVATALAQIMRFYQWPEQAGQSAYRWDLMRDNYNDGGTYSQEEKDAVARLMSDIGAAINTDYGSSSSGASHVGIPEALVGRFGYDRGLTYMERNVASDDQTSFDDEQWWPDMLRKELDEGRPIYYMGSPSGGFGKVFVGHAFVCDGYDSEGYFHFNFGWSGACNGWFVTTSIAPDSRTSSATTGYSSGQAVFTHIQPDCGGRYYLGAWLSPGGSGLVLGFGTIFDLNVEYALCVENNDTRDITYTPSVHKDLKAFDGEGSRVSIDANEVLKLALKDGQYTMWPVYRITGDSEWLRPEPSWGPAKYFRDHFDVSVRNGVTSVDYPDEFKDENFRYKFVSDDEVAIISCFSSSGDGVLTYPSSATYSGTSYPVTAINASPGYSFTKVIIPASVKTIGNSAFWSKAGLEEVVFEEGSSLREIRSSAFSYCTALKHIDLPETLEYIYTYAFSDCRNLTALHVPTHLRRIGPNAFEGCSAMKSLTFAPDCELQVIDYEAFSRCPIEGDLVFPSALRECRAGFDSPYITSADFSKTRLRLLGITEEDYTGVLSEFSGCTQLKSLLLPPTIRRIGCLYIPAVEAFNIPDCVEYIYELNIPAARFLNIPAGCEIENFSIGQNSTVVCGHKEPACYSLIPARNANTISTLYVPVGSYQAYKSFTRTIGRTTYRIQAQIIEMLPYTDMNMTAKNGEAIILGQSDAQGVLEIPSETIVDEYGSTINVTSIASYAFYGNTAITCVDLPSSIGGVPYPTRAAGNGMEGLGEYAFAYCSGLVKVIVHWDTPLSISPAVFHGVDLSALTLIVPDDAVSAYQSADVWKDFGTICGFSSPLAVDGLPVSTPLSLAPAFNLAGQPVGPDYKGIVITAGKKYLRR